MYTPSFRLDGKTAIITGAGRGIGRALSIGLAESGAEVILLSRTKTELEETASFIEENGGKAHIFTVDVTKREEIVHELSTAVKFDEAKKEDTVHQKFQSTKEKIFELSKGDI